LVKKNIYRVEGLLGRGNRVLKTKENGGFIAKKEQDANKTKRGK